MKKICFLIALAIGITVTHAQPLSGSYLIGTGTGADYSTLNAAVTDLMLSGVSGPVVFNITPGTYVESIEMGAVSGTSLINTVTFQSQTLDSSDVTLSWPSSVTAASNYTLRLNGASFLHFKHITFQRTGSLDFTTVVDITNASHDISFTGNRMSGLPATSSATYKCCIYGANGSTQSNILISNNRIENGSYGVWLAGISQLTNGLDNGNKVLDNVFVDQYFGGVVMQYQAGPKISGNEIQSTSLASGNGIYTFFCDNDLRIENNKIDLLNGKGIYVHNTSLQGSPVNLVANNFVAVGGGNISEGLLLDNSKTIHVYHNSVHLYNTWSGSSAFKINGLNCAFNELRNNVFANSGGGYALNATSSTGTPFNSSDYNNFYSTGTNLAYWKSAGNQTTLSLYQSSSGLDYQSVSVDPQFYSSTDLHSTSLAMNNMGTSALSSTTPVLYDIDGDIRSTLTPDIGADEYGVVDLALLFVDSVHGFCESQLPALKIRVANKISLPYTDSLPVRVQFGSLPPETCVVDVNISPNDTVDMIITGSVPYPSSGHYSLTVDLEAQEDINHTNDSLSLSVFVSGPFSINLGGDFVLCTNENLTISTSGNISSYLWHDSTTAPSWFVDGSAYSPGQYPVKLYAENDRYCVARDSLVMKVFAHPKPQLVVSPSFVYWNGSDSITVICDKLTSEFTCGNFADYIWHNGSSDSVYTIHPGFLSVGHYVAWVNVSDTNGCQQTDSLPFFMDDCIGTNETEWSFGNISVYPNPSASGVFVLKWHNTEMNATLRIFNSFGDIVEYQTIGICNSHDIRLDLQRQPAGVYILDLSVNGHSEFLKLVKQ